jgi:E3 ubiquitin-protein ligase BRE1
VEECLAKLPAAPGDIRLLQQKLTETLGALKSEQRAADKLRLEAKALQTGYEGATERYLKAEKKLDRLRSGVLTNLEKQGRMQSTIAPENEQVNGDSSGSASKADSGALNELRAEAQKALLEAEKRKEHLDKLEEENKTLMAEVTTLTTRITCLSDEDFAKTDLFKASKAQQEDLIKRINHLEATHIQLRDEAKKYQAERMAYRRQVDEEARKQVDESEQQLGKLDADLQRIRQERDLLQDKVAILRASKPEFKATIEKVEMISKAKDERIAAFEEQVRRLQVAAKEVEVQESQELDSLSPDELKARVASLRKELDGLKSELPHMETAYTKYHSLAMKKVNEFRAFEDRISQLNAEKAKADQKYYGAMKDKDARDAQNKILQAQNNKTSALISAFKENETKLHEALRNLEKQVAEHQAIVADMTNQHQVALQQAQQSEATAKHISLNVVDLKKKLSEKDDVLLAARKAQRDAEVEVEKLKVDVASQKLEVEEWRKKARSNPTEEVDLLRVTAPNNSGITAKLIITTESRLLHSMPAQPQRHNDQNLQPRPLQRLRQ